MNNGSMTSRSVLQDIIGSRLVGLGVLEAAGEMVAEDARFTMWVLARKPRSTSAELWNMAAFSDVQHKALAEAWDGYRFGGRDNRPVHAAELIEVLRAQKAELVRWRESDTIEYSDPAMPQEILS